MATFVPNLTPIFCKTPRTWEASIGNGDASAWKLLRQSAAYASALPIGANGSKVVSIHAASTDSSSRIVQVAKCRNFVGPTMTIASPGVHSWSLANGNNVAIGDQVMFLDNGDTLPTGLAFNTTYWVIAGGFVYGSAFELATSAGGSAINNTGSQSGTHSIVVIKPFTSQTVAITAGTDGVTAQADLLGLATALPNDQDAQKYTLLEGTDFLAVSSTTTVTANKMISVHAEGGDF